MAHRRTLALFAAAATTIAAPLAHAHGGIPRAYTIRVDPGDPNHIVFRSVVWGLFHTLDGGNTWSWSCSEVYEGNSTATERRSMAMTQDGSVFIAAFFDGLKKSDGTSLCNFTAAPEFDQQDPETGTASHVLQDVRTTSPDGSTAIVLTATGGTNGVVTRLWSSSDGGASWAKLGAPVPADGSGTAFSGSSAVVAPSNAQRIYVSGKFVGGTSGTVARSDDGGATWQTFDVPATSDNWNARLYGVDPNDADVVFFWADLTEDLGATKPDQLWMSTDAGATWSKLYESTADLPGFAFSPDGATVAFSGPGEGLHTASIADLVASGESAIQLTNPGHFWGLEWRPEGLYAGTDDFAGTEKFTIGISTDGGQTFRELGSICEMGPQTDCAADSQYEATCPAQFSIPAQGGYKEDILDSARCVGAGGASAGGASVGGSGAGATGGGAASGAGATPPVGGGAAPGAADAGGGDGAADSRTSAGCSCRASEGTPRGAPAALALVAGLVAAVRRRRRS